ncbi:MAG: hypothetical protein ACR2G5_10300 [Pyrinomonadaceae bacterium]
MRNLSKFSSPGRRFLSTAGLLFVLGVTTNAYTIVMRGGKRIEIPAQFTVTRTTLTYEAAPTFLITLQLTAIDIPATERANNETAGSLLGRAAKQQQSPRKAESTGVGGEKAMRSVTNRDLEAYARMRVESDRAHEQKRKELGLPPLEVARAQFAAETERFWQELERKRAEDEANDRAAQLQAQIAALSNQLNYVQARVSEGSYGATGAFYGLGGVPFYTSVGRTRINRSLFGPSFGLPFGQSFGLPIGRPFGSFHAPFGFSPRFHGLRRNVIVPGVQFRGRIVIGRGPHTQRRFR